LSDSVEVSAMWSPRVSVSVRCGIGVHMNRHRITGVDPGSFRCEDYFVSNAGLI
jgi:hypothetical protein